MTDISNVKLLTFDSKSGEVKIDVRLEKESIWLNQNQISSIFDTDRTSISRHISNIYKSKELVEKSTVQNLHTEGSNRPVKYYNLDVILSVGYRVNSKKATKFRIWATKTLRDYIVKGYAVDEQRLLQNYKKQLTELKSLVDLISSKSDTPLLAGQEKSLLSFLKNYSKSINILEEFDKGEFTTLDYNDPEFVFNYENCLEVIESLRKDVISKNPYNNLFGVDVDNKLQAIVETVNQTYDGNELYTGVEEKAANLLYLLVKDHPFLDGNKRIASMLLVYYLEENKMLKYKDGKDKFTENGLATLTLLVASSMPKEKDLIIKLIIRLIQ